MRRFEACSLALQVAWWLWVVWAVSLAMMRPDVRYIYSGSAPGYTLSDGKTIVASR